MKRGLLILSVILLVNCLSLSDTQASNNLQDSKRPNIIFVMVDDMGRDWISCYGAKHQTPNIDRLAKEGLRYETAWCNPICTPTRVTLLTGQYAFRHGWTHHYDVARKGRRWAEVDQVHNLCPRSS